MNFLVYLTVRQNLLLVLNRSSIWTLVTEYMFEEKKLDGLEREFGIRLEEEDSEAEWDAPLSHATFEKIMLQVQNERLIKKMTCSFVSSLGFCHQNKEDHLTKTMAAMGFGLFFKIQRNKQKQASKTSSP